MQLAEIPYPELKGTPDGILILTALKAQPLKQLMSNWLWKTLINDASPDTAVMLIRYIIDQDDIDKKTLLHKIESIHKQPTKRYAMTVADQLREEGYERAQREHLTVAEQLRQEGYELAKQEISQQLMQEGYQHAKRSILQQQLTRKYGTLPPWAEQKLADADPASLENWADRIFDEIRLEEMLS